MVGQAHQLEGEPGAQLRMAGGAQHHFPVLPGLADAVAIVRNEAPGVLAVHQLLAPLGVADVGGPAVLQPGQRLQEGVAPEELLLVLEEVHRTGAVQDGSDVLRGHRVAHHGLPFRDVRIVGHGCDRVVVRGIQFFSGEIEGVQGP